MDERGILWIATSWSYAGSEVWVGRRWRLKMGSVVDHIGPSRKAEDHPITYLVFDPN